MWRLAHSKYTKHLTLRVVTIPTQWMGPGQGCGRPTNPPSPNRTPAGSWNPAGLGGEKTDRVPTGGALTLARKSASRSRPRTGGVALRTLGWEADHRAGPPWVWARLGLRWRQGQARAAGDWLVGEVACKAAPQVSTQPVRLTERQG